MPKTSKSDISLNEKDALRDMLTAEKALLNVYSLAVAEGSTKQLRSSISKNYQLASNDQFTIFEEMTSRGYYPVTQATKTDIDNAIEQFKTVQKELEEA